MKVAITGASGYLGAHFAQRALQRGWMILSLARRAHPFFTGAENFFEVPVKNLISRDSLSCSLDEFSPQAIIHIAALSSPAACEVDPQLSELVNVKYSQILTEYARSSKVPFYFVSSDLVFEGLEAPQGGFREDRRPAPLWVYGKAKYQVEQLVLNMDGVSGVLRSCLQYGKPIPGTSGMEDWLHQAFKGDAKIQLFHDEWRTPVYVGDVAESLCLMTEKRIEGVFHAAGPDRLSRVELGSLFAGHYRYPIEMIEAVSRESGDFRPPRARDVSLSSDVTQQQLGVEYVRAEQYYSVPDK